jgi:hypothetical protein
MKIDIIKDHPTDTGPMLSTFIVPKKGLGDIVRETTIRAHRSELEFQLKEGYVGQVQNFKERCDALNGIFDRYSGKGTFEELMHSLYKGVALPECPELPVKPIEIDHPTKAKKDTKELHHQQSCRPLEIDAKIANDRDSC